MFSLPCFLGVFVGFLMCAPVYIMVGIPMCVCVCVLQNWAHAFSIVFVIFPLLTISLYRDFCFMFYPEGREAEAAMEGAPGH